MDATSPGPQPGPDVPCCPGRGTWVQGVGKKGPQDPRPRAGVQPSAQAPRPLPARWAVFAGLERVKGLLASAHQQQGPSGQTQASVTRLWVPALC